jgi:hypothetical protein
MTMCYLLQNSVKWMCPGRFFMGLVEHSVGTTGLMHQVQMRCLICYKQDNVGDSKHQNTVFIWHCQIIKVFIIYKLLNQLFALVCFCSKNLLHLLKY